MSEVKRSGFYVYALFRDSGDVFYVGKGYAGRWLDHAREARRGKRGHRFNLIREMQSRGVELPIVKIHDGLTEAVAHEYEIALIAAIGRYPHGPLLNVTEGGEGARGARRSEEFRANQSARQTGQPRSLETKAKLRAANLGKKQSLETVAKRTGGQRGRPMPPGASAKTAAALRGRKFSPEHCANLSAALLGRSKKKQSAEHIAKRLAAIRNSRVRRRN